MSYCINMVLIMSLMISHFDSVKICYNINMENEQIKYVAVRPGGSIVGPMGDTSKFVKGALIIGYCRAAGILDIGQEKKIWNKIKKLGYRIRKCKVVLIDE